MKRKKLFILSLIGLCLITGCGKNKQKEEKKNPQNDAKVEVTKKVTIVDENSNTRPYAVVINNYPSAIKVHSGLDKAYLIYEFPIEGGYTRSLALYKDIENVKIGTIRSSRQYHIDYVLENDAIFVHFGWNHPAQEKEIKLGIDYIDGNTKDRSIFYRENPLKIATEHTVYTNLEQVIDYTQNKKGYRTTTEVKQPFSYSSNEINLKEESNSIQASTITLPYSKSYSLTYSYDEEKQRYVRTYNDNPHKDYFANEAYSTKNIIIEFVETGSLNGYTDAAGSNYLDLKNIGSGTGYYITNGYARKIKWAKKSVSSQTVYTYEDGEPLAVNDGNTFINIFPSKINIDIQ